MQEVDLGITPIEEFEMYEEFDLETTKNIIDSLDLIDRRQTDPNAKISKPDSKFSKILHKCNKRLDPKSLLTILKKNLLWLVSSIKSKKSTENDCIIIFESKNKIFFC